MARTPLVQELQRAVAEVAAESGDLKTTRAGRAAQAGQAPPASGLRPSDA